MDPTAKAAMKQIQGGIKSMPWWEPAKDPKLKKVRLQISIPAYNNSINVILDASLRQSLATTVLGEKLWTNQNFCGSDSLICRARDKLAGTFLEGDAEWQLQIDDDIIFPYGLGPNLAQFYQNWMDAETFNLFLNEGVFKLALSMNAVDEILRSGIQDGKTIVGGLYFWRGGVKNFNQAASIIPPRKDGGFELDFKLRPDNYINTDRLATGFLLIHRSVYEDVQKKFPELEYDEPRNIPGKTSWAFYTPSITTEHREVGKGGKEKFRFYRSEDYAFAWRAKEAGHAPCLNMNILLGHLGTHIYSFFDRPTLQKLMFDLHNNPQHTIEKIPHEILSGPGGRDGISNCPAGKESRDGNNNKS